MNRELKNFVLSVGTLAVSKKLIEEVIVSHSNKYVDYVIFGAATYFAARGMYHILTKNQRKIDSKVLEEYLNQCKEFQEDINASDEDFKERKEAFMKEFEEMNERIENSRNQM